MISANIVNLISACFYCILFLNIPLFSRVQLVIPTSGPPGSSYTNTTSTGISMAVPGSKTRSAQVHISYLTKQVTNLVSEQMIFELFSNFGQVIEVSLKKKYVDTVSKCNDVALMLDYKLNKFLLFLGHDYPKRLWLRSLSID